MSLKSNIIVLLFCGAFFSPLTAQSLTTPPTDSSDDQLKVHPTVQKVDDAANPIPLPEPGKKLTQKNTETKPEIQYDVEKLPLPVKMMRQKILEAAKSGDINNLKPLLGTSNDPTQLSVSDNISDPIAYLKQLSGDGNGLETMAILIDLLNSGFVHLDEGDDGEIYVWPYFVAVPLETLTNRQLVELFQIMTAGDFEEMKEIGTYSFFRIGITPDGRWRFFITGD